MGEEPSTSGSAASGATVIRAASDPETIREEIDATRQQLGDTIEALAEKTDLRAQAKHELEKTKAYVSEKKDDLLAQEGGPAREGDGGLAGERRVGRQPGRSEGSREPGPARGDQRLCARLGGRAAVKALQSDLKTADGLGAAVIDEWALHVLVASA